MKSMEELVAFVRDHTGTLTDPQHESVGMFAAVLIAVQEGVRSAEEVQELGKVLDLWHFPCRDPYATQRLTRGEGEALFAISHADSVETGVQRVIAQINEKSG